MASPPRFLRALVAVAGLAALTVVGPGPTASAAPAAAPAHSGPDVAPGALVDDAPLRVEIGTMSPATLPTSGEVRVTGTVTNRTEETWSSIELYSFVGDRAPVMRNQGQLQDAMAVPYDDYLGDRILVGEHGEVETLAPGETRTYSLTVPADAVRAKVSQAGVYWFGVHALGVSESEPADDGFADGRARTFLPYVPQRFDEPLEAALVVPLSQPVRYEDDGSVADVEGWEQALADDGRLTRLLEFVDTSGRPTTWLVDPALIDAIGILAAGNPARSLSPTPQEPTPTDDPGGTAETPPSSPDDGDGNGNGDTGEGVPDGEPLPAFAVTARAWLDRLGDVLEGDEVLSLPYGNIDVPATVRHAPALLDVARVKRSRVLAGLGIEPAPAVSPPSGYLDTASIRATDPESRVLVTDRMFGDKPPAVAEVEEHRLVVTSYGATQGSPGPGPSLTSVGVRQRLLAEAAVRVIKNERNPLTVVLPIEWSLSDPVGFFSGLAVPWLDLGTVSDVDDDAVARFVAPDDLDYLRLQARRELDETTVAGVADLIEAGGVLQDVLIDNNEVAGVITEEALTGLSYFVRNGQSAARVSTAASQSWIDDRLGSVQISASPGVTLSGVSGNFVVTLSNDLEQGVVVGIVAESDAGIEIVAPERIELAAQSRTTVLIEARTTTNRVHNVRLLVTDPDGTPLGSVDELPIRSAQVSDVIWLIIGTGAGLMFLAIAVRLVRRVRTARRGGVPAVEAV